MAAAIIPFRRRAAASAEPLRELRNLVFDPRICSDHRTALMLVAEAAGRPISLTGDLESLTAVEAESALTLVRRYFPDRCDRLQRTIVERRMKA